MNPVKPDQSALEQLEELRAAAVAARAHAAELTQKASTAAAAGERAMAPLSAYHADVGAGRRERDERLESKLAKAVKDAQASLTLQHTQRGPRLADLAAEAEAAGAHEAAEEAQAAADRFIPEHREELEQELAAQALEARERLFEGYRTFSEAVSRWNAVRGRWITFGERWGTSPADVPPNPFGGAIDDSALAPHASGEVRDPARWLPAPMEIGRRQLLERGEVRLDEQGAIEWIDPAAVRP